MAAERHFEYDELDAYLHGDLPLWKRILCGAHLRRCLRCKGMLQHVREDNRLLEDGLMKSLAAGKDKGAGA